jgi:hypothetical protein
LHLEINCFSGVSTYQMQIAQPKKPEETFSGRKTCILGLARRRVFLAENSPAGSCPGEDFPGGNSSWQWKMQTLESKLKKFKHSTHSLGKAQKKENQKKNRRPLGLATRKRGERETEVEEREGEAEGEGAGEGDRGGRGRGKAEGEGAGEGDGKGRGKMAWSRQFLPLYWRDSGNTCSISVACVFTKTLLVYFNFLNAATPRGSSLSRRC